MTTLGARCAHALLVLLALLCLLLEVVAVPRWGRLAAEIFPSVEPLLVPAYVWSALLTACAIAAFVVLWKVIDLSANESLRENAPTLAKACIGISLCAVLLLAAGFVAFNVWGYTPPALMYGLIGLAGAWVAFALTAPTRIGHIHQLTGGQGQTSGVA